MCVVLLCFTLFKSSCNISRQSLSLVDTLLQLAECGHYEAVKALFDFPIKHCADVLLLALLQSNVSQLSLAVIFVGTNSTGFVYSFYTDMPMFLASIHRIHGVRWKP